MALGRISSSQSCSCAGRSDYSLPARGGTDWRSWWPFAVRIGCNNDALRSDEAGCHLVSSHSVIIEATAGSNVPVVCRAEHPRHRACKRTPTRVTPGTYAAMTCFSKLAFARCKPLCGCAHKRGFRSEPRPHDPDHFPLRIDRPHLQLLLDVAATAQTITAPRPPPKIITSGSSRSIIPPSQIAEIFRRFFHNFLCQAIATRCGLAHNLRGDAGNVPACHFSHTRASATPTVQEIARAFCDGSAGGVQFDATSLAATAQRPAKIDRHMSAFSGAARPSLVNPPLQYQRRTDAGAEAHVEYARVSLARAPASFRQRRRICVIDQPSRQVRSAFRYVALTENFASTADLPCAAPFRF